MKLRLSKLHLARCLPVCAVVLVAFNSSGSPKKKKRQKKKHFTIWCGLTDNFNSIKKKQQKKLHLFFSAVYSRWKNLCLAQRQADASLLITGALLSSGSSLRLQIHPVMQKAAFRRIYSAFACSHLVYKYNKARFLFSCGAQHLLTFGTMSHERCKLPFSAFFLKQKK